MTRQYAVYAAPGRRRSSDAGYVVVLQSHYTELNTVVVAPLLDPARVDVVTQVMVLVELDGRKLLVSIGELAAIDRRTLREPVGDLTRYHDEMHRSLWRLFNGA